MKKTYYGESLLFRLSLYRPLQEAGEIGAIISASAGLLSKYYWEFKTEVLEPLSYTPRELRKALRDKKIAVRDMDAVLMIKAPYKR